MIFFLFKVTTSCTSTTWTDQTDPVTTWTPKTDPATNWSETTNPTTTWIDDPC